MSTRSVTAFDNSHFYNPTSVQSIALAAQMDRGSAFLRQGASGTTRRRRRILENEMGAAAWKDLYVSRGTVKSVAVGGVGLGPGG